jgi:hypothetical protein
MVRARSEAERRSPVTLRRSLPVRSDGRGSGTNGVPFAEFVGALLGKERSIQIQNERSEDQQQ